MHAEVNVLLTCAAEGVGITDAEMVITRSPCMECLLALCNSGLSAVHWPDDDDEEWLSIDLTDAEAAYSMWNEYVEGAG